MRKVQFIQADVFTDSPFGGNPVVVIREPGDMSPDQMQRVARGMGHAETSFVVRPTDPRAAFGLRCFTPTTEVVYSAHQLLGTAYVMAESGDVQFTDGRAEVIVQIGDELRPIRLRRGGNAETTHVATEVVAAEILGPVEPSHYHRIAAALTLDPAQIASTSLPPSLVRTGLTCLIVPLASLYTVRDLMPVGQAVEDLLHELGAGCMLVFCRETLSARNQMHVRVFAPPLGIDEDPATGSANGALGAYLLHLGMLTGRRPYALRCEQGYEMGRPSLVEVEIDTDGDAPTIRVGGNVVHSVEGTVFY
ncbi:MAG: PhzF family phenazine biosynthesis protein [Ardenticatenales bacterium]